MLDWDFGLYNILFCLHLIFYLPWAKCLVVSSHDWCAYLSFPVICQAIVGLYHLQNDVHHYTWLLCWGHLCRWGTVKPCSDERQNGFKGLKLKHCKFLQPFFTSCEQDCFCPKTLKHFRFKCLRWFLEIKFFWFF